MVDSGRLTNVYVSRVSMGAGASSSLKVSRALSFSVRGIIQEGRSEQTSSYDVRVIYFLYLFLFGCFVVFFYAVLRSIPFIRRRPGLWW